MESVSTTDAERLAESGRHGLAEAAPVLDDIARLAAHVCTMPMALISLIDEEREWFRSSVGRALDDHQAEESLCVYAIVHEGIVAVGNLLEDPRFRGTALAAPEALIRAYAGVRLATPDGQVSGALCVMHHEPREVGATEMELLEALGRQIVVHLNLRRTLRDEERALIEREMADQQLRSLIARAHCILWHAVVEEHEGRFGWNIRISNEGAARQFLPVEAFDSGDYGKAWYGSKLEEDRDRMDAVATAALRSGQSGYSHEFRCRRVDGEIRWLLEDVHVEPITSARWHLVGVCTDITEIKNTQEAVRQSEETLRVIAHATGHALYRMRFDTGEYVYLSPAIADLTGYTPEEIGKTGLLRLVEKSARVWDGRSVSLEADASPGGAVSEQGASYRADYLVRHKSGERRWLSDHSHMWLDASGAVIGSIGVLQDITERKRMEEALRVSEERSRTLLASLPQRVFFKDCDSRFVSVNPLFAADLGMGPENVIGKSDLDLFPPDLAEKYRRDDLTVIQSRMPVSLEERNVVQGYERIVEVMKAPVINDEGRVIGVLGLFTDITDRKRAQQALRENEQRLRAIFEGAAIGIAHVDLQGCIIQTNPALQQMVGYSAEELCAMSYRDFAGPESMGPELRRYAALLRGRLESYRVEKPYRRKDGRLLWATLTVSLVRDADGRPLFTIGMVEDVTDRQRYEEQIRQQMTQINYQMTQISFQKAQLQAANARLEALATTDGLTGVANHRTFHRRLADEAPRAQRYGSPLSLVMLDVDDFKSYNDKNGHLAGDEVLRTISRILRKSVRSHDLVARYGGEEFAIIMPALACDQAIETAERLRVAIEGYAWPLAPVTASLGVSTLTAEMADGRDLLQAADDALYASKAAGRNRATHSARLASTDS